MPSRIVPCRSRPSASPSTSRVTLLPSIPRARPDEDAPGSEYRRGGVAGVPPDARLADRHVVHDRGPDLETDFTQGAGRADPDFQRSLRIQPAGYSRVDPVPGNHIGEPGGAQ